MYQPYSQNSYYENYYAQVYNRTNFNPNPSNQYYSNGGYGYGNPNLTNPQIYQNNYRGLQMMQPMKLDDAIKKSSYTSSNKDIILEAILYNFSDKKENKVYFQSSSNDKIFIISKTLSAKLLNRSYNIPIIIHIPESYPNLPPEFYIHKKPKVGINKAYYENEKIIDVKTFKINKDKICKFNN